MPRGNDITCPRAMLSPHDPVCVSMSISFTSFSTSKVGNCAGISALATWGKARHAEPQHCEVVWSPHQSIMAAPVEYISGAALIQHLARYVTRTRAINSKKSGIFLPQHPATIQTWH